MIKIDNIEVWGMIPSFLNGSDDPLWKQIDLHYAHGGGWRDFDGFEVTVSDRYSIKYFGDPDLLEQGRITKDNEMLVMFDCAWVLWTDGVDTKIARID